MSSGAQLVDDAFGVIQTTQGIYEVSNSTNPYEAFTTGLSLVGGLAATTPFGVGLNSAATVNNTTSALSKFQSGSLLPSDVLQITASALTLVALRQRFLEQP